MSHSRVLAYFIGKFYASIWERSYRSITQLQSTSLRPPPITAVIATVGQGRGLVIKGAPDVLYSPIYIIIVKARNSPNCNHTGQRVFVVSKESFMGHKLYDYVTNLDHRL